MRSSRAYGCASIAARRDAVQMQRARRDARPVRLASLEPGSMSPAALALSVAECQSPSRTRHSSSSGRVRGAEETMAKTKFRPLHDRVVVRRIEAEEKSAGGIIIPDTAKEKPQQGEVIAVGPGGRDESGKLIPIDLKVGDKVLFGKWSGTEVKLDGQELLIMKESDIMGVLA